MASKRQQESGAEKRKKKKRTQPLAYGWFIALLLVAICKNLFIFLLHVVIWCRYEAPDVFSIVFVMILRVYTGVWQLRGLGGFSLEWAGSKMWLGWKLSIWSGNTDGTMHPVYSGCFAMARRTQPLAVFCKYSRTHGSPGALYLNIII
jgi:hypothetical protein